LISQHFGPADGGCKAYIQASLHADEPPGMLVQFHLRKELERLEAAGQLAGEIVLVPLANPIGVAQRVLGNTLGRFSLAEGENFNRHYADLSERVLDRLRPAIDAGMTPDVAAVRAELRRACTELGGASELDSLRRCLLGLAIDADWVLDLHCDNEAVMHLYAATPQWPQVELLARATGAEVSLLATDSGDDPFDESCSMLWSRLNTRWRALTGKPDAWPLACIAVTLELRGEADVSHALAQADASAIITALQHAGFLHGPAPELPELRYPPTPLAGSLPVRTPAGGVLVHLAQLGARVSKGERIAEVIDVISGTVHGLDSPCDGILYARVSGRTVQAGLSIAKVAGASALRSGKLLSA
jgi:predicted deacylase